jgi:hypothetical protein
MERHKYYVTFDLTIVKIKSSDRGGTTFKGMEGDTEFISPYTADYLEEHKADMVPMIIEDIASQIPKGWAIFSLNVTSITLKKEEASNG